MHFFLFLIPAVNIVDMVFGASSDHSPINLISSSNSKLKIIDRLDWGAKAPTQRNPLLVPVPYVVIHHSSVPQACYNLEECKYAMRDMQNMHVDENGWADIGYNWAVGSDGRVYEGRGWDLLGAHSLHFNNVSLGICLIGNWTTELPPSRQLRTARMLIEEGVKLGYIKPDYKLVGHRQVRETECPGQALYEEIQDWENYSSYPRSVSDLADVFKMIEEKVEINQAVYNKSKN